jgi:hypothetical protein
MTPRAVQHSNARVNASAVAVGVAVVVASRIVAVADASAAGAVNTAGAVNAVTLAVAVVSKDAVARPATKVGATGDAKPILRATAITARSAWNATKMSRGSPTSASRGAPSRIESVRLPRRTSSCKILAYRPKRAGWRSTMTPPKSILATSKVLRARQAGPKALRHRAGDVVVEAGAG